MLQKWYLLFMGRCSGVARNFKGGGSIILQFFFQAKFFSTELIIEAIKNRKTLGRSGGMLYREIFEILHAVMAILVLFEHFSGKLCLNSLTLILSATPNVVHFVRTVSIVRA